MNRPKATLLLLLAGLALTIVAARDLTPFERTYQEPAARILAAAKTDEGAWTKLVYLCDRIGHRLGGSPQLDEAIRWAAEEMKRDGLENVQLIPTEVPHWVRGRESARILSPRELPLHMLGLGGSVGTPGDGIRAEVAVVRNFDELEALGRTAVEGKIVVYNAPWQGYGPTVAYRSNGAVRAARLGAVAALVRSVTPRSLQSPHTGAMRYEEGTPKIPSAAISVEDAELLQRFSDDGVPVEVELFMEAENLPPAPSANVVGEIVGRSLPDEVVVIGGHIDSWDVGQGAHDDGGGVVVSMQAARLLLNLGLRPRRTIRVVLFTNEENGLRGGVSYRDWVGEKVSGHVAAIEMDAGAERPVGFGLGIIEASDDLYQRALDRLRQISFFLEPLGAGEVTRGGGGADISPIMRSGVPGLGLRTVGEHYFDWHHTAADTVDKVSPEDLRANLAAMALYAYILADMPERLTD